MNCEKGDLAMVVHAKWGGNLGRIVKVVQFAGVVKFNTGETHQNCWLVEGEVKPADGSGVDRWSRAMGADACVPDAWLRPIRDPGEDACDESLRWLPVPSQHKEVA